MSKTWDLKLDKYSISPARYRELKYFCLQYLEWKHMLSTEAAIIKSIKLTGLPGAHNISDMTGIIASKRAELAEKCKLVEDTARETNTSIYQALIKNITKGIPYEYMDVPCGKRQFYESRRKFFYLLSQKK